MKKLALIILAITVAHAGFAQYGENRNVIITLNDTVNIYSKVRKALEANDFIIEESLSNRDSLITQPRAFKQINGWSIATVKFTENSVIISGIYGLKNLHSDGVSGAIDKYYPIRYYGNSRGWKVLMQIANNIKGKLSYSN